MGNRAVITAAPYRETNIGIYVHWNGGKESIEGFVLACKELGYRDPLQDCYGWARLCEAIAIYFGGELSVGIDVCANLDTDNGDNGTRLLGPAWTITDCIHGSMDGDDNPEKTRAIADTIKARIAVAETVE